MEQHSHSVPCQGAAHENWAAVGMPGRKASYFHLRPAAAGKAGMSH